MYNILLSLWYALAVAVSLLLLLLLPGAGVCEPFFLPEELFPHLVVQLVEEALLGPVEGPLHRLERLRGILVVPECEINTNPASKKHQGRKNKRCKESANVVLFLLFDPDFRSSPGLLASHIEKEAALVGRECVTYMKRP